MVLLDQFYQVTEKETAKISVWWKVLHVGIFVVIAVSDFLASFTFGRLLDAINYNCILNAKIVFTNDTYLNPNTSAAVRAIDTTLTIWGSPHDCNFVQFAPLFSMITAVVFGTFFIVLAKGGAGSYNTDFLGKPFTILYPCICFTTISLIIYLVAVVKLNNGITGFCKQFKSEFGTIECVEEINIYIQQFHEQKEYLFFSFNRSQLLARTFSEIGVVGWGIQLILLLKRVCCVVDFDIHLVTIMPKEEERVESVIEFHDDDSVSSGDVTSQV